LLSAAMSGFCVRRLMLFERTTYAAMPIMMALSVASSGGGTRISVSGYVSAMSFARVERMCVFADLPLNGRAVDFLQPRHHPNGPPRRLRPGGRPHRPPACDTGAGQPAYHPGAPPPNTTARPGSG
jgi:hypothetical protein